MNAVTTAIDFDSPTPGYIEIGTGPAPALGTLLVTITLEDPSFANATAAGAIVMATPPAGLSGLAVGTGTAQAARIRDGAGTDVVTGLVVGTAIAPGVEIALSALAISAGQTVTLTQGTITHAA
jgi:hypothetical protein